MKKKASYSISLLLHTSIVLILMLLFHCLHGVKESIGYGTFSWQYSLATLALAGLLIYTLRLAAQHRHPRVAESVLGLTLIPLVAYFWLHSHAETERYNYILPAQSLTAETEDTASSPTRIELSPEVSISLRGYQESQSTHILHLDIKEGDKSRRALLDMSTYLDIGKHHTLSLRRFHLNENIEPIAAELHYESHLSDTILKYTSIAILAALLLVATTYICRVHIWGLGSALILLFSTAILIISYTEHGVEEQATFVSTSTENATQHKWYPNLRECASSVYMVEAVEYGKEEPLAIFSLNVSQKFEWAERMLAVGERANAANSYISYLSYERGDGSQGISCRYAHWPYLNMGYMALCLGLMMLAYTYYRVCVLHKHIAEKADKAADAERGAKPETAA